MSKILQLNNEVARRRRAGRFAARHVLWDESGLRRARNCGRAVQRNGCGVTVKMTDGAAAGYGNLQTCGSVWACPVCSAKIAATRQNDIERILSAWYGGYDGDEFGRVALVTLTMRHRKGQSLKSLWEALSQAWNLAVSGAGWADDQEVYGTLLPGTEYKSGPRKGQLRPAKVRIPVIRVVEVTHGDKGWHVHIHALLLLPSWVNDGHVDWIGQQMWNRWLAGLEARGLDCDRKHGVDARLLHGDPSAVLGEYFVKATYSASHEVARSDMKSAHYGNRTPFAILADIVDNGDADDLDTWHEYERASKGKRQITMTRGLRALLLPPDEVIELTDEEIAEQDAGGDEIAEIGRDLWSVIVARRADYKILRAFERSIRNGYRLLWLYADQANLDAKTEWARLLAEPDPKRRRLQSVDPG
jgi:hypothetical protein